MLCQWACVVCSLSIVLGLGICRLWGESPGVVSYDMHVHQLLWRGDLFALYQVIRKRHKLQIFTLLRTGSAILKDCAVGRACRVGCIDLSVNICSVCAHSGVRLQQPDLASGSLCLSQVLAGRYHAPWWVQHRLDPDHNTACEAYTGQAQRWVESSLSDQHVS